MGRITVDETMLDLLAVFELCAGSVVGLLSTFSAEHAPVS